MAWVPDAPSQEEARKQQPAGSSEFDVHLYRCRVWIKEVGKGFDLIAQRKQKGALSPKKSRAVEKFARGVIETSDAFRDIFSAWPDRLEGHELAADYERLRDEAREMLE